AGRFAANFPDARVSVDLESALTDAQVHGVLLLTPPNTHLELGARIAKAGKHLLVEKPIELNSARALGLVTLCEQRGVVAAAVLQHRTRTAARKLRALPDAKMLGEIHSSGVAVPWGR